MSDPIDMRVVIFEKSHTKDYIIGKGRKNEKRWSDFVFREVKGKTIDYLIRIVL